MQQEQPFDITKHPLGPQLLRELDDVLRKLQERVAVARDPEHRFALVHLVEGLSLADWRKIAAQLNMHGWLALPIDKEDGVPLQALRETLEELTFQRDHDMLTGLANRRLFDRQVTLEMQRSHRTATPLSLVMLDLDNFKEINDTHGHATGDKVLMALGDLLLRSLRIYDIAARIGGEEFCLVLPGASTRQAADLAMRVLDDFRGTPFETPDGGSFFATFSAGIATSTGDPQQTYTALLAQADELLYEAKRQGKNRVLTMATRQKISDNPALVQAVEKQFLFTGKTTQ
ncbi:GGDEF domain-containing protein [Desulfovibrio sp. OttesenSCG-928-O18]|nr:GGDEF domain-containing protein [Desulfovibrio sp. OttesenSCG-928-O18]